MKEIKDTAIAAALLAKGHGMLMDRREGVVYFIFVDSDEVRFAIQDYHDCKLDVDAFSIMHHYKSIIRRIKEL